LHPLIRLNKNSTNQNIFEQIASTSEIGEEIVKKELLILEDVNWMLKTSNVFSSGGKNTKQCFL
jgi:hypothetical protein